MRQLAILILFSLAGWAGEVTLKPVAFEEGSWRVGAAVKKPDFRGLTVTLETWPAGLVPMFAVQKAGVVHLRRFPLKGQENISEPVFFGLPLEDEKPYLGGRWEVQATRPTDRPFLYWELMMEGPKIAGRFDRYTDYRFGVISAGEFVSNRLELKVEYIADSYLLKGTYMDGKFKGDWKRTDDAEAGTWEAKQKMVELPPQTNLAALFEWRKGEDRVYRLEEKTMGDGWVREKRALCRVWRN